MVTGYKGTPDLGLALERGEIDGYCGFDWASLKSQKPNWVRDKVVNVLIQDLIEPNRRAHQARRPAHLQVCPDEHEPQGVELILSQQVFHRSFIAPPETPPAQLAVLRGAFDATMKDPQFLADAEGCASTWRRCPANRAGGRAEPLSPRRRTSSNSPARRSTRNDDERKPRNAASDC